LEADYLKLKEVAVKRITVIKFVVNDGDVNGTNCCGIKVTTHSKMRNCGLLCFEIMDRDKTFRKYFNAFRCINFKQLWISKRIPILRRFLGIAFM